MDEKSNEKTTIPQPLVDLDLENAVVSIDAMACSSSIAAQIIEKKGDYLLFEKEPKATL